MSQRSREHEETFALEAGDPYAWLEHAKTLKIAAEPILERLRETIRDSTSHPAIRNILMLAYSRGYMLLTGFAFENLLKAIAVGRGLITPDNGRLKFDPSLNRQKSGHSLTGLSHSLKLQLAAEELDYLGRLEEYTYWGGRYPVSNSLDTFVNGYSARRLSFKPTDPSLSDRLFDKLSKLISRPA